MKRNNDIKHYSSKEEKCRTKALRRPDADLSLDPTKRTHTSTSTPEVHNQNQMLEFPASSLIHPQASNQQISNIVQHESMNLYSFLFANNYYLITNVQKHKYQFFSVS